MPTPLTAGRRRRSTSERAVFCHGSGPQWRGADLCIRVVPLMVGQAMLHGAAVVGSHAIACVALLALRLLVAFWLPCKMSGRVPWAARARACEASGRSGGRMGACLWCRTDGWRQGKARAGIVCCWAWSALHHVCSMWAGRCTCCCCGWCCLRDSRSLIRGGGNVHYRTAYSELTYYKCTACMHKALLGLVQAGSCYECLCEHDPHAAWPVCAYELTMRWLADGAGANACHCQDRQVRMQGAGSSDGRGCRCRHAHLTQMAVPGLP